MSEDQVELFGEIGGLFAPEMLPCTPPELVQLLPGDYTATMVGGTLVAASRHVDAGPVHDDGCPCSQCGGPGIYGTADQAAGRSDALPLGLVRGEHAADCDDDRCVACADDDDGPGDDDDAGPIVLIPCSGSKLDHAAPAVDLYTGSLFQLALKAARTLTTDDRIRIFSARHGLIALDRVTEPYEQRMGQPGQIGWHVTRDQLRELPPGDLVALLPNDYAADLLDPVRGTSWRPFVNPLAGCAGIGEMRHRLAAIAAGDDLDPEPDEPDELAEIEHVETLAPDADPADGWANAHGPSADLDDLDDLDDDDDDDGPGDVDWTDRPEYRWTTDQPPSLVDVVSGIAPWVISETIGAATDTDAAKILAGRLSSSGHGDGRGYIEHDTRGAWLVDLDSHTRTLAATWTTVARELRAVATPEDYATMADAIAASAEISRAGQDDQRPWVPAYRWEKMTSAERFEHTRADREHERRQRRRDEQRAPLDYAARTVQRDLEARLAGPRPGALF